MIDNIDNESTAQAAGRPCIPQEITLTNVRLATAYVPFQKFCSTFSPIRSLVEGTAFPELFSPYIDDAKIKKVKEKTPWIETLF